jgi:hypothetical protein
MSVRRSLGVGPAFLGLALIVVACSGVSAAGTAANGSGYSAGPGNDAPAGPTSASDLDPAEPTFDLGALLSSNPTPAITPATSPATSPSGPQGTPTAATPAPPVISTSKASSLLAQVDHLLNELDDELSNADAAANNPGE